MYTNAAHILLQRAQNMVHQGVDLYAKNELKLTHVHLHLKKKLGLTSLDHLYFGWEEGNRWGKIDENIMGGRWTPLEILYISTS